MSVTGDLLKYDPGLRLHNEGEWSKTISTYSAFNDAGVECEVGELLYSFIRVLKPRRVLETGTHWGIGASYIGIGLQENGFGVCDTFEFIEEHYRVAAERIFNLGLADNVKCHLLDVAKFEPEAKYQMMLLDTEPQTRFAEWVKFYDWLDEGGYIFIHDLHRSMHQVENKEHGFAWPFGLIPEFIKKKVKSGEVRVFHFPTPRGLTGFYKMTKSDYVWG